MIPDETSGTTYWQWFPRDRWLVQLLLGWSLPLVVGALPPHGHYAIMLWRRDPPEGCEP